MGRGKILIEKIENPTNRQITFSKRKNGIIKKASELSILCDARVSLIILSSTNRIHEFTTPTTTTKQIYDDYQRERGIDLWSSHYEKMQESLKVLKDTKGLLQREVRQRKGEKLSELSLKDLRDLQQEMENTVKIVRDRKYQLLGNRIETTRKKVRNAQQVHRDLLLEFDAINEDPYHGLVDDGADFDSIFAFANIGGDFNSGLDNSNADPQSSCCLALRLQSQQQPYLHKGTGSDLTSVLLE